MSYDVRFDATARALVFVPAGAPAFERWEGPHHLFVAAGLQDPARWQGLIGRQPPFAPALAFGLRCATLDVGGCREAFLLEAHDPHHVLLGTLFLGLSDDEIERFETPLLDDGLRRRVALEVVVGDRRVPAFGYLKRG